MIILKDKVDLMDLFSTESQKLYADNNESLTGESTDLANSSTKENNGTDEPKIKYTVKDSLFCDLFSNKSYTLELYKTLHPEDQTATEDDIEILSIRNVLVNAIYNDLGFTVRDKLLLMVEAQSTWSVNIAVRILFYLAETWKRIVDKTEQDMYGSKKLEIPEPEFYVIYIGKKGKKQETIKLSQDVFGKFKLPAEIEVNVIYCDDFSTDIINQYLLFCKILTEQQKICSSPLEAINKTIAICKDRNILKKYLESKEVEVRNMMFTLFDEESIQRAHEASIRRESEEKGVVKGIGKGKAEERAKSILALYDKGFAVEQIAELLDLSVEEVGECVRKNRKHI